jgi:hypothetical protein
MRIEDLNFRNTFDAISYVSTSGVFDLTTLFSVENNIVGDFLTKEGFFTREILRSLKLYNVVKITEEFAECILDKNPNAFDGKIVLFE